jgi:hypothetical protein
MRKIYFHIIVICLLSLAVVFVLLTTLHAPAQQRHITLGAWTQNLFDAKTQQLHPEKLTHFEQMVQKKLSIAHYYIGWEALTSPKLLIQF